MFKKALTLGLVGLLNFSPVNADKVDDFVNSTLGGNGIDWRLHLWDSMVLTTNDSFLLRHTGYGEKNDKKPEDLAAKVRFLDTINYQGILMSTLRKEDIKDIRKNTFFDLLGIEIAHDLYPRLRFIDPIVDKLADISDRNNLKYLAGITGIALFIGYTYPGEGNLYNLNFDEQTRGNNLWKHIGFASYYTFTRSLMLEHAGYEKHPPESLAWRNAYGVVLAKELILDARGKGPSIRDVAEGGVGIALGYGAFKIKDRVDPAVLGFVDKFNPEPYHKGIKFTREF
ncbi:MAG: hypothetical protein CMH64_04655 [Nanoarchaeota archaeon]|nr:hypothetical protein [Nanoarchaeota archaeon]